MEQLIGDLIACKTEEEIFADVVFLQPSDDF